MIGNSADDITCASRRGKRKRGNPNQRMNDHKGPGSGRTHVHFLVWLRDAAAVQLPAIVRADVCVCVCVAEILNNQ